MRKWPSNDAGVPPPKLRLIDRIVFNFVCMSRVVDGLWLGGATQEELDRVERALQLIKEYDPQRYRRLPGYFARVLVVPLLEARGRYNARLDACEIEKQFLLDPHTSMSMIASTIVHEATHARLRSLGFRYEESGRQREEQICGRQEMAFLTRVPNATHAREEVEWRLNNPEDYSEAGFARRRRAAERALLDGLRSDRGFLAASLRALIHATWAARDLRLRLQRMWRRNAT